MLQIKPKLLALALLLFATIFAAPVTAQNQAAPLTPLKRRADDVLKFLQGTREPAQIFSPAFLAEVSPAQLAAINKELARDYGKAINISRLDKASDTQATLYIDFEKGDRGTINLFIEAAPPHLISGLRLTSFAKIDATLQGIADELKKLPGQTALTVARLKADGFEPVISYNADAPLAIGSAFKLYVLGELTRQIAAGERNWTDVIALRESSFPSGFLQDWPAGSPLTLHTLAALMISQSDNTATDQLIETLGRENVERTVKTAGNQHAARNIPFLKTREMFALKGAKQGSFASRYSEADIAERRVLLAGEIASLARGKVDFSYRSAPSYIDQIEWFASPNDLVRALNWLRTHGADGGEVRGILGINRGLPAAQTSRWKYVGFKGGSETGVISLSYLLQAQDGQWFAVSASWNDPKAAVEEKKFASLIQQAVELVRPQ